MVLLVALTACGGGGTSPTRTIGGGGIGGTPGRDAGGGTGGGGTSGDAFSIQNLSLTNVTSTTATVAWTTSVTTTSSVDYGLTQNYGSSTAISSAGTTPSFTISGLVPSSTYHFRVRSKDSNGVEVVSSDSTFITASSYGTAPQFAVTGVRAENLSTNGATIVWTTTAPASSQVEYGKTTSYGSTTPVDGTQVTNHSVNVTGLESGATYHYRVHSANPGGPDVISADATFSTLSTGKNTLVISKVAVTGVTESSVMITWETNAAATSKVEYGTTMAYGSSSNTDSNLVNQHSVTLTGLVPGTLYHARVNSADTTGFSAVSGDFTFTTTTPLLALTDFTVSSVGTTSAVLTWVTNAPASSIVEYGTSPSFGSTVTDALTVTNHTVTLTDLAPGTQYFVRAKSQDPNGTIATSGALTFTTVSSGALAIYSVSVNAVTSTSVAIAWSTTTPANSLVEYGTTAAYGSSTVLDPALVTNHLQTLSNLAPNTTYHFRITSVDSSSAVAQSPDLTFTTMQPTLSITNANVPTIGFDSATISWTTNIPATSQVEYGTTTAYGTNLPADPTLVTQHSVIITGLQSGVTYHARAHSSASGTGDVAGPDLAFSVSTKTPLTLSNVVMSNITADSATMTWTTNSPATSQVEYGTTTNYGFATNLDSTLVTSHQITINNLSPSTTYNARPRSSTDPLRADITGDNVTFTTSQQTPTTVGFSNITATNVASTTATISWTTSVASLGYVEYGSTTNYGGRSSTEVVSGTSHSVVLQGLVSGVTYHYRVHAVVNGNDSASGDQTFTTLTEVKNPPTTAWPFGWKSLGALTQLNQAGLCPTGSQYASILRTEGCSAVIRDWTSGILRTATDQLLITGGGHTGYGGNELYALTLQDSSAGNQATLKRFTQPTVPGTGGPIVLGTGGCNGGVTSKGVVTTIQASDAGPVALPPIFRTDLAPGYNVCVDCQTDAKGFGCAPDAKHTYDQLTYIPPNSLSCVDGVTTGDVLFEFSGYSAWDAGTARADAWVYHFSTGVWQRLDTWATYVGGRPASGHGKVVDWDPVSRKIIMYDDYNFGSWDLCTNTYTRLADWTKETSAKGAIDYKDRIMVITNKNSSGGREVYHYNIDTNTVTDVTPNLTAKGCSMLTDLVTPGEFGYIWSGLTYDPDANRVVMWPNFGNTVYDYFPGTQTCSKFTYSGDTVANSAHTGASSSNGTFGRFRYVPSQKVFVLINDWSLPAMVLCRNDKGCP
ncbi:MAG TPA: fibronectin type III domain-containing protein [Terriglobales bacterium]|nr:fibronectin type III domain-containing protein [Terriglobales bacterium]